MSAATNESLDEAALRQRIGRSESVDDVVTPTPVAALSATLDALPERPADGTPLPPLWHWLYFLPLHRQSEIGPDGHALRGGFLPPVPLPRRMWAGSQLTFHEPLRVGDRLVRTSTIDDVTVKRGRSGTLVFVRVRHLITRNGANPNFVFRVSAVDDIVDRAMLQYAEKNHGAKSPGIIVVNNPWGESNQKGLTAALQARGMKPAGVEKFEANDVDVTPQLSRLKSAGSDVLLLVGNVGPSAQVVKSLDRMGWKVPIVSHWGPAGGRFTELAGPNAKDVVFVQTYSFFGKQTPVGQRVLAAMQKKYPDVKGPGDVTPAVGVANAYDAMHLVALAIQKAGSTDGDAIRQGFYKIDKYDGLIKTYVKPFTPDNHDAINENDYVWTRFVGDEILPVGMASK